LGGLTFGSHSAAAFVYSDCLLARRGEIPRELNDDFDQANSLRFWASARFGRTVQCVRILRGVASLFLAPPLPNWEGFNDCEFIFVFRFPRCLNTCSSKTACYDFISAIQLLLLLPLPAPQPNLWQPGW
jgi:hypothetical protein